FSRDWSSDVCSSDLSGRRGEAGPMKSLELAVRASHRVEALEDAGERRAGHRGPDLLVREPGVDAIADAAEAMRPLPRREDLRNQIGRASCRERAWRE